jgi:hypothetical protein
MSNSLLLTIVVLVLIAMIFVLSAINSKKKNFRKKDRLLARLDNLLAQSFNYRYSNSLSCGENLKKSSKLFRKDTYQNLWDVHKLRNDVVHNNRSISKEEAQKSYHIYKLCIKQILK